MIITERSLFWYSYTFHRFAERTKVTEPADLVLFRKYVCKRLVRGPAVLFFFYIFSQSRARCQNLPGTLLSSPCVKLKDKMLLRKDEHIWTAQVPQRGTSSVEMLSSSWKGKKSSDLFQAVPSSMGYLEPLEDCE